MPQEESFRLNGIELLSGLPSSALRELEGECRWRECAADEVIVDRNHDDCDVYFVVRGAVEVVNYSLTDRTVNFAKIEAGDYFGELAAIDRQTRSASVVTLEDTVLARMAADKFNQLVLIHPELATKLLHRLTGIIRIANNRIVRLIDDKE